MNFIEELEFARALAAEAGQAMRASFGFHTAATWKEDNTPVTAADIAINQLIIDRISQRFPRDGVLGEEQSTGGQAERLWVVDPIDGTQAYTLGAPLSTFCLALVIDGQPVVGMILDPYLNREFWAVKGEGAFVNDRPLKVSAATEIAQNYVILSSRMGHATRTTGQCFDAIEELGGKVFNFRSFAYGSMFVAAGSAVGTLIGTGKAWDVAATKLIVEEAGGRCTDIDGKERRYDEAGNGFVASNGLVHDQLLRLIHP